MLTLTVAHNTVFKRRPLQSTVLSESEIQSIGKGQTFDLQSYAIEQDHVRFALHNKSFKGFNTWYAYLPHVELRKNDQVVSLKPELLSLTSLHLITHYASQSSLKPFIAPLNQGFDRFYVNTPLRIAHFLAQVLHESGEFKWLTEIHDGSDYEGRHDLGNIHPGDGKRFRGRGAIQITGRANFEQISKDLGVDYTNNPERLSNLPDAVFSAFWYWQTRGLNSLADKDDIVGVTRRINGGVNGLAERKQYLQRAKSALRVK